MTFDDFIDFINFNIMKIVQKLHSLKSNNLLEEEHEEVEKDVIVESDAIEKSNFFDNATIFDELTRLEIDMFPIKAFSKEKYDFFMEQYKKIKERAKQFYEEEENSSNLILTIDPLMDIDILKEIKSLEMDINSYKEKFMNYSIILERLKKYYEILEKAYLNLFVKKDLEMLESANNSFSRIISETSDLKCAENKMKMEEISYKFCEVAYLLYKSNVLCGVTDLDLQCIKILSKERQNAFSIFQKNVEKLLQMIEVFNGKKYYNIFNFYFSKLLKVEGNTNFDEFVKNEKKVYELYVHYTLKKENKPNDLDISKVRCYFNELSKVYSNVRLKFLLLVVEKFNFNITYYELHRLLDILGLEIFCNTYLKNVTDDNDLIKEVFEKGFEKVNVNGNTTSYIQIYVASDEARKLGFTVSSLDETEESILQFSEQISQKLVESSQSGTTIEALSKMMSSSSLATEEYKELMEQTTTNDPFKDLFEYV